MGIKGLRNLDRARHVFSYMEYLRPAMNRNLLIALLACIIPVLSVSGAELPEGAEAEALIRMAREHLGGDEKLESIQSLKYVGTIDSPDRDRVGTITLYLKKPLQQRIEIETESGMGEITAVNGYEGWILIRGIDERLSEVKVMDPQNLNRMLVSTWENLHFFAKPVAYHGKIHHRGETEYRGRPVYELHVVYPGGTPTYVRFFDRHTGELVGSRTDDGLEFIESGMILVDGIQFPRKIEALRGERRIHIITFEEIEVNPPLDDELFEFPSNVQVAKPLPSLDDYRK